MVNNNNFIKELKNKNPEALDYVLDTFGNLIYKLAYTYTNSRELSEECVNDVLLKVWNCIPGYDYEDDKFKNWIASIAKHTSIDMIRKEKKHFNNISNEDLDLSSSENIEEYQITKEELQLVKEHIMSFKELDRNIFIQRFFMNKSIKEIGDMFDMTPKAINLRILRARKTLTIMMDKMED